MTVNDAVGSSPSTVQHEEDTEEPWQFYKTSRSICKLLTSADGHEVALYESSTGQRWLQQYVCVHANEASWRAGRTRLWFN